MPEATFNEHLELRSGMPAPYFALAFFSRFVHNSK
jgi:hypothetical protein